MVVTGGAGGIGRGIVDAFVAHGAGVVVVDIDETRTTETVADVVAAGGAAHGVTVDITEPGAAGAVVEAAMSAFGAVDVLVNNVGHFLFPGRSFVDSTPDEWAALYAVNLDHVLRITHAVLPPMIERGVGGSIINLTTVEAFRGIPQHPVYAAFKAGVTQFGRSLALDVGRHAIRVNDIAPDVTRSRQLPYERWLTPEDTARIPTWVPLGRLGQPATRQAPPCSWRRTWARSSPARRSTATGAPTPPAAGTRPSGATAAGPTVPSIRDAPPRSRVRPGAVGAGPRTAPDSLRRCPDRPR